MIQALLLMMILATSAGAIGIAPANQEIDAAANVTYRIYNTDGLDFVASIGVNGSMAKYIELENEQITFKRTDKYKTLLVHINDLPNKPLTAEISIRGPKSQVVAKLRHAQAKKTPTGLVVGDTEEPGSGLMEWIIPIILGVVIAANIIYFLTGKSKLKTPEQLLAYVKKIEQVKFSEQVNNSQNKIADMANEMGHPTLAYKLYDATTKQQMLTIIAQHLGTAETDKNPNQLKAEIKELKKELDTFDFSEFEKHL